MITAVIFDFAGVITNEGYWQWLSEVVPNISEKKDVFQKLADKADCGDVSDEEYRVQLAKATGRPVENIPQ